MKCWSSPETPVKPEGVFIEVGLQVLLAHSPMVRTQQPSLNVREDSVHMSPILLLLALNNGPMVVSFIGKRDIAGPTIGVHNSALFHALAYEGQS